jgi:hypothetical protein
VAVDLDRAVQVVDLDLAVGGRDRQVADLLLGDPARDERRDEAVRKAELGRDVLAVAGGDRGNRLDGPARDGCRDVDVVDHQVHHRAVGPVPVDRGALSAGGDRDGVDLREDVLEGGDGRVEPLDVADLEREVATPGLRGQFHAAFDVVDERFLDQRRRAVVERRRRHGRVLAGGDRDGHGLGPLEQLLAVQHARLVAGGDVSRDRRIGVGDADEFGTGEFVVHPRVVAPHRADADDADGYRVCHSVGPPGETVRAAMLGPSVGRQSCIVPRPRLRGSSRQTALCYCQRYGR